MKKGIIGLIEFTSSCRDRETDRWMDGWFWETNGLGISIIRLGILRVYRESRIALAEKRIEKKKKKNVTA